MAGQIVSGSSQVTHSYKTIFFRFFFFCIWFFCVLSNEQELVVFAPKPKNYVATEQLNKNNTNTHTQTLKKNKQLISVHSCLIGMPVYDLISFNIFNLPSSQRFQSESLPFGTVSHQDVANCYSLYALTVFVAQIRSLNTLINC